MTVSCTLTIRVNANGNIFNVNIPDGMNRPTIDLIMGHISKMDAGVTGVNIDFSDGRISIAETRANRMRARSDNNQDTTQIHKEPADKQEDTPTKQETSPADTETPAEQVSPQSLDDAIEHKIGVNISHGLSASPVAELDVAHHANGRGQVQQLPSDADFINDGVCDDDIQQGGLGDCWFLAALASVADDRNDPASNVRRLLRNKIIMGDANKAAINQQGDQFQFNFYRMGEWHTVTIDGELPTKRRARSSKTKEWWVPLTEKAYAKFNGSYDNIESGVTSWGLAELTSGIPIKFDLQWDKINPIGVDKFKSFVKEYLAKNAICCAGNEGSGGEGYEDNGLISGHAYSVLNMIDIDTYEGPVTLVRIRNPWGRHEWNGAWSDDSDKWNMVTPEIKAEIGYEKENDGGFFMSLQDWVEQFETFTMCYMNLTNDNQRFGVDQRVIGTLIPGVNAAEKSPNDAVRLSLQFTLTVEHDQDVWIQPLQNQSNPKEARTYSLTALYDADPIPTSRMKMQYRQRSLEYLKPMLATRRGRTFVPYKQAGYCYRLKAGTYFLMQGFIVATQREYMIRIIGNGVTVKMLE